MKNLLLITLLFLISCSNESLIPPKESLDTPDYMKEVFEENFDCAEFDFFDLTVDNQNILFDYENSENRLCTFAQGNSSGANCEDCEAHFAALRMPMDDFNSLFPNFPVQVGMIWDNKIYGMVPITKVNMKRLGIVINVPTDLTENILIGSYYYSNLLEKGINLYFHWEIKYQKGTDIYETGYQMTLDENRPYNIEINCIDRSTEGKIRLSGSFSGVFVGDMVIVNTPYEMPISGKFSYNITL